MLHDTEWFMCGQQKRGWLVVTVCRKYWYTQNSFSVDGHVVRMKFQKTHIKELRKAHTKSSNVKAIYEAVAFVLKCTGYSKG